MKAAVSERVRTSSTGWRSGLRIVSEDGVITGIAGAAAVSVVFVLLDFAQGRPFFTPSLLGSAIFQGQLLSETSAPDPTMIFAYTGLHVIAFLIVGFLLAGLFRELEKRPKLGIELLVVFLVLQGLLMGAEVTVFPALVGELGAWAVATANVASLIAMFGVLAYRHPEAIKALRESE
jgi:glycopeptide antibiotics resistance protein